MAEFLLVFSMMFIMVVLILGFLYIPIMIANARGICGGEKTTIVILSWLGIFFGITWCAALILSLIWGGNCIVGGDNLDRLEKLARLYKDKVISKAEFEEMKAKLLGK